MNYKASTSDHSEHTMILGMKVKVEEHQGRSKAYLSIGLMCMVLALAFHIIGSMFQYEFSSQATAGHLRTSAALEIQAWIRTCSMSSFVCLWIGIMTLFQVAFQHRKSLKAVT